MPLYEYECSSCGHRFEVLQKFSDDPVSVCTKCSGQVSRLVFPPAIQFKGTGWYVTDYARKAPARPDNTDNGKGKAEEKPAAASPETKPGKESSSTSKEKPTAD